MESRTSQWTAKPHDGERMVAAAMQQRNTAGTRHPYLTGIHAPMTEELTLTELPMTGTLPWQLNGQYLRIGPNPVAADPAAYHPFAGDGMVHGLRIEHGKARWYRNRWIRSNAVAEFRGVPPAPGPRHAFDTVNTNVLEIGGRTFALVEGGSYPVALGETLDAQCYDPLGGSLKSSFTAHPHRDPDTGESHAICYEFDDPGVVRHVVIDASGRVTREQPIAMPHGPMIHDCAITARFVVILDLPVVFSADAQKQGRALPYHWDPSHPARVGLMPRNGFQADIIWCPVKPGYVFHVANAYDDADGCVVLDVCAHDKMFVDGERGMNVERRGLERWTIDPVNRNVSARTIDASAQEFPRSDERFFGRPYRYVWTLSMPTEATEQRTGATKLFAHDLATGTRLVHDFGAGHYPGEFVFVPETPDSPEGAGWLMGFVVDLAAETTDLVIIDSRHFAQPPVARIHLPHRVPPGFHGNWISRGAAQ